MLENFEIYKKLLNNLREVAKIARNVLFNTKVEHTNCKYIASRIIGYNIEEVYENMVDNL